MDTRIALVLLRLLQEVLVRDLQLLYVVLQTG
jgi:hypothetical protein